MRRRNIAACLVGALAALAAAGAPTAVAAPSGAIHPGVQTYTSGAQCTANFVFADATSTYIGQAAHCSGTGAANKTNGCTTSSLPLGTPVTVTGASRPGTLVYNSWLAMQAAHETDGSACAFNDFALIRLDPADSDKIDPTMPGLGGPNGVGGAAVGAAVFSYGNSKLRLGLAALRPKQGLVVQVPGGGWSRAVYTVTPGIPGDSGSGFVNARGQAVGILSTLSLAPLPLANGVGDLSRELTYMRNHSTFTRVQLVNGRKPFRANLLGAIIGG
ncbi:MAG TPA: serine protease [Solirubrobacteraceae bacterium]